MASSAFISPNTFTNNGTTINPTVPIAAVDGTVAAPGQTFASDTASGRYRIGANNIGESIAGTLVFDWNASRLNLPSGYQLAWNADTFLQRDAANIPAVRNSTTSQQFRVYNTYTDGSNYERAVAQYSSGVAEYGHEFAGTGVARNVRVKATGAAAVILATNGVDRWVANSAGNFLANTDNSFDIGASGATRPRNLYLGSAIAQVGGITTSGVVGTPAVVATGRSTAQAAAVASVSTFTVGAADASFIVSANVLVTTATTHNFTVTCAYTDEGNTARTLTFNFSSLAGVFATAIINTGGAVPYEGVPMHIRCKASTAITIATTGTFTTVVYNVEGLIAQVF